MPRLEGNRTCGRGHRGDAVRSGSPSTVGLTEGRLGRRDRRRAHRATCARSPARGRASGTHERFLALVGHSWKVAGGMHVEEETVGDRSPRENAGMIRVGPAGWFYKDWEGIVYPPNPPKGFHGATYLAQSFDTIEVNSSFYSPP